MFSRHGRVTRIIMVDQSRAVVNVSEVRDSVRAIASASDVVILFDSVARVGSLDSLRKTGARGSLSAALAAATRAAVPASANADSIELVLVSPLAREELDAATDRLRAAWPGRVRLVAVSGIAEPASRQRVEVRAAPNDAVAAGLSLMGVTASAGPVRVVRTEPTRDDTLWATTGGRVLVHWPARDSDAWKRRPAIDAIGGVTAGAATVVARFPRLWVLEGRTIARWSDGEPAAVERATGDGCIRDVGVLIDDASDLALRAPFRRFAAELVAPCGGTFAATPIDSATRASLAGTGALAPAIALHDRAVASSRWTPWLLALAALLLIAELALRRPERAVA